MEIDPENCGMYDRNDQLIKCKCGRNAVSAVIGNESFAARCTECYPLPEQGASFVYHPPYQWAKPITGKIAVKFAQHRVILDDWWLIGGTRWSRAILRLKHPIVYSKRGLRNLWRRIKHIFFKPKMIQPLARHPHDRKTPM